MSILERLARFIFDALKLDFSYTDSNTKKVVYQLLYIGLTKLYGGEHISERDIQTLCYKSENGMDTARITVLGSELFFYVYNNLFQAVNSSGEVVFQIEQEELNSYELYVRNLFNVVFRYTVSNITETRAEKYSYIETQGDTLISHGDLITMTNKKAAIESIFKMVVYDKTTNTVIPDNDSFLKKMFESIKADNPTNTTVSVLMPNQSAQIYNLVEIFETLKVRLDRYYQEYNKNKVRVRKPR